MYSLLIKNGLIVDGTAKSPTSATSRSTETKSSSSKVNPRQSASSMLKANTLRPDSSTRTRTHPLC